MPWRFCDCSGCPACPQRGQGHLYDRATSPGHNKCAPCQQVADRQHEQRRGTTAQRGYGSAHQRTRAAAVEVFRPGQACARCGRPIWRAADADLGHTDDRQGYRGLEHSACNRGASAQSRRGRPPRSAPAPPSGDDGGDWVGIL